MFTSGRDFVRTMLNTMPLRTFLVDSSGLIRDLDFINIDIEVKIQPQHHQESLLGVNIIP
jgi:hypothetical protein